MSEQCDWYVSRRMDSQQEPHVLMKKNKMMNYREARLYRDSEVSQPLKNGGKHYFQSLFVSLLEIRGTKCKGCLSTLGQRNH